MGGAGTDILSLRRSDQYIVRIPTSLPVHDLSRSAPTILITVRSPLHSRSISQVTTAVDRS